MIQPIKLFKKRPSNFVGKLKLLTTFKIQKVLKQIF